MKNYGFQLPEITEKDFVLGAERSAPFEVINRNGQWAIPPGEIQVRNIETFSCTAFGTLNAIEILHLFYTEHKNYSERFQAILSGQNESGNDPQKVCESIRIDGVIPEEDLPFTDGIGSFREYLSPKPMTKEFIDKGKAWKEVYDFKHEYLFHQNINLTITEKQALIKQGLQRSPIAVSVKAWQKQGELYVKNPSDQDTHWTVIVGYEDGEYWKVYDSYPDGTSFEKKLAWDYNFQVAKGFYLHKYTAEELKERQKGLLSYLMSLLKIVATYLNIIEDETARQLEKKSIEKPEKKSSVEDLARAIEIYEGVNKALNNPGGLRLSPFQSGSIIQSVSGKPLATFKTYEAGFQALIHQIRIVCNGQSPAYTKEAKRLGLSSCAQLTLGEFIRIYAPDYENKTEAYIQFIEKQLGIKRSYVMKNFL